MSESTQVLWVRHGQSTWNAVDRMQGRTAHPPLTELGRRQAAAAAERLRAARPLALLTSPAVRARETADILGAALGLTPVEEPLLVEKGLAEDWGDVRVRARRLLDALPPDGPVVAVSHGDFIPVALLVQAGLEADAWSLGALANGQIATVDPVTGSITSPAD